MLKKTLALLLTLSLLVAGATIAPAALASEYYSGRTPLAGATDAQLINIDLAVEAINGTVIPYGGTFSFNELVGPRTAERGYVTAANGRGVMVTGGGVAQVASTVYLALLDVRGNVRIDPVRTYGNRFVEHYVTDTDYAIITDYDSDIDLSFTNYGEEMTIELWSNESYVYCSITVGKEEVAAPESGWFITPLETQAPARRLVASASLVCGGDDNLLTNVELASDCVTDTTLNSGDIFSFNDTVGPRSKEYGYVDAVNGRGATVRGGGVAQVASVLWLAIKNSADFAVIEKSTYGKKYNQDYVASSSDAILTDYKAGRDFSFRYTGLGSVTIYTSLDGGILTCEIFAD